MNFLASKKFLNIMYLVGAVLVLASAIFKVFFHCKYATSILICVLVLETVYLAWYIHKNKL